MDKDLFQGLFTRTILNPFSGDGKEFGVVCFLRIAVFGKARSYNIGQGSCDPVPRWISVLLDQHNIIGVKAGHVGQLLLLQPNDYAFLLLAHDCHHHPVPQLAVGSVPQRSVLLCIYMDNLKVGKSHRFHVLITDPWRLSLSHSLPSKGGVVNYIHQSLLLHSMRVPRLLPPVLVVSVEISVVRPHNLNVNT